MTSSQRRLLAGRDAQGRSMIEDDREAQAVLHTPGGGRIVEIWRTDGRRDLSTPAADVDGRPVTFAPGDGQSSCRLVRIPPDSQRWGSGLQAADLFASMGAMDSMQGAEPRHPGMHVTPTLDYVYVVRGEVVAVMEKGETRLAAGDVLVQRATVHAWKNDTDADAEMFVVMIGIPGIPDGDAPSPAQSS